MARAPGKYAPPTGFVVEDSAPNPIRVTVTDTSEYDGPVDADGQPIAVAVDAAPDGGIPPQKSVEELAQMEQDGTAPWVPPPAGFTVAPADGSIDPENGGVNVNVTGGQNAPAPEVGRAESVARGYTSGALLGGDDELGGLMGAAANKVGQWVGANDTKAGFWDVYEQLRQEQEGRKNAAWDQNPGYFLGGFLPGAVATAALAPGKPVQGANFLSNAGRVAVQGTVAGGASGALNAQPGERISSGAAGAATGALLAPLVLGGASAGGRLISRVGERIGVRNVRDQANSGINYLSRRMSPEDLEAVPGNIADIRAVGGEPALIDAIGETGRGVVRQAVGKSGSARTEAAEAADNVYADAQDRVANAAGRVIGGGRRTSRQLAADIRAERNAITGPEMDAVRDIPVPVTPQIAAVLQTPEGQRALRAAAGLMTEGADRAAVGRLIAAGREIGRIDPRMPGPVRERITQQLLDGAGLTVDIADKFSRSLLGRASQTPGLERVARAFGNDIRDAARAASPEYGTVLDNYSSASRVADAAEGTGRFLDNSDFLKTPTDTFRDRVVTADRTRPFISGRTIPSESEAIQLRARTDIVDRATKSPADAYSTAKTLSTGSAQGERTVALLGPRRAGQLRDTMRMERDRFRNTAYVDERTGSKTAGVIGDDLNNEIINFIPNAMANPKWAVVRGLASFLKRENIRGIDAERLTRDAISRDPDRVDAAVAYLVNKGMSQARAYTTVRSIGANMIGRTAGSALNDGKEEE